MCARPVCTEMCARPEKLKIILGDFNYPDISWDLSTGHCPSANFRDTVNDCFLTQLIREPTRGSSVLDLVLTNDPSIFREVEVIEPLLGSDHKAISCTLSFDLQRSSPSDVVPVFDFSLADWNLYSQLLDREIWDDMFSNSDPNVMWNILKDKLLNAASIAIPRRKCTRRYLCGIRVCGEVKRAINARKKLYKRYRSCSNSYASVMLRDADERLRTALSDARTRYERNVASHLRDSPRIFWKHVRKGLGNKPSVGSVESSDGSLTTSDAEAAEQFNIFFASVFVKESNDALPLFPLQTSSQLNNVDLSELDLHKLLTSLPSNSSSGPDGIANELLAKAGPGFACALRRFLKLLFDNGVLPSDWCLANVLSLIHI